MEPRVEAILPTCPPRSRHQCFMGRVILLQPFSKSPEQHTRKATAPRPWQEFLAGYCNPGITISLHHSSRKSTKVSKVSYTHPSIWCVFVQISAWERLWWLRGSRQGRQPCEVCNMGASWVGSLGDSPSITGDLILLPKNWPHKSLPIILLRSLLGLKDDPWVY